MKNTRSKCAAAEVRYRRLMDKIQKLRVYYASQLPWEELMESHEVDAIFKAEQKVVKLWLHAKWGTMSRSDRVAYNLYCQRGYRGRQVV